MRLKQQQKDPDKWQESTESDLNRWGRGLNTAGSGRGQLATGETRFGDEER